MYIKSSRFHTERGKIVRNDSRTSGMAQKKYCPMTFTGAGSTNHKYKYN